MTRKIRYLSLFILAFLFLLSVMDLDRIIPLVDTGNTLCNKLLDASQLKMVFAGETMFFPLVYISLAILVDIVFLGWKGSAIRKVFQSDDQSIVQDLVAYIFVTIGLFAVFQFLFSLGVAYIIAGLLFNNFQLNLLNFIEIPYLQTAFLFVLLDFKHWLGHWVLHKPRCWHLHAFHHSASEFTLFTNARGNFLEEAFYSILTALFITVLGAPILDLFYFFAFKSLYGLIIHSDINYSFGWLGRWVLITPKDHKLHHSILKEDYGKNFGTLFKWWDLIFGTYKPNKDLNLKIGINDNPYNSTNYLGAQWIGAKKWWSSLISGKID